MSEVTGTLKNLTIGQLVKSPVGLGSVGLLAVGGLATAAVLVLGGWRTPERELELEPLPVRIQRAEAVQSVIVPREFVGEVQTRQSSDLAFERSARLQRVLVDDGDSVTAGQSVAELDTEDLQIAKRKAQAALDNARAVLDELEAGARQEVIAAARAEVAALQADRDLAEFVRQKRSQLVNQGISQEEWQQVDARFRAAEAQLQAAQSRLAELEAGIREEKIRAQKALVSQLTEEVQAVELEIQKSTLRAPFDGAVAVRYRDEGVVVAPGEPILRIIESGHLEVMVGIPPDTLPAIQVGDSVDIVTESKCQPCPQAVVRRILPESDKQTRMVPVVFALNAGNFKPGQLVRLSIRERIPQSGIWVPTSALIPGARGLWSLYVVREEDGILRAVRHSVNVLFNSGERSLVSGALDADEQVITSLVGQQVVTEGTQRITQGQRVTTVESPAKTNTPPADPRSSQ